MNNDVVTKKRLGPFREMKKLTFFLLNEQIVHKSLKEKNYQFLSDQDIFLENKVLNE